MKTKCLLLIALLITSISVGQPIRAMGSEKVKPIVLLIADKMDSVEFFGSELPAVQQLFAESTGGLLNIRSGSGYTNTNSGYLTIGAGNRSVAPGVYHGAYAVTESLGWVTAADFWGWSGETGTVLAPGNLLVPEIGWIGRRSETKDRSVVPGLLGSTFRDGGWLTFLIGNVDNQALKSRPAGLLLMDKSGLIAGGRINEINNFDSEVPYALGFSSTKVLAELEAVLQPQSLIVVEFGDFARLDRSWELLTFQRQGELKRLVWQGFDQFIGLLLERYPREAFDLVVLNPSLSRESWGNKHSLAPVVIRSSRLDPGLLVSATTRWAGVVANVDLLPTLANWAGLVPEGNLAGRSMKSQPNSDYLPELTSLLLRLNAIFKNQRSLLDWYLGLISVVWVVGGMWLLFKRNQLAQWSFLTVATVPLVLIGLPLLPTWCWNGWVLVSLTLLISLPGLTKIGLSWFKGLTLFLWLILTVDQLSGWHLIRFSGLGYSAAAGSRYYGMGNELMGTYLAVAFLSAHFLSLTAKRNWVGLLILGLTLIILGSPRYGIDYGGTLTLVIGIVFYAVKRLGINWRERRLWLLAGLGVVVVLLFGFWDAFRPIEVQTHVGMFFRLILNLDFTEITLVLWRKLSMNLKLLVFSPWTRIVLLVVVLGMGLRYLLPRDELDEDDSLIWQSILVCGIAAELLNDSGIVALGTCLAYGFSYYCLRNTANAELRSN